MLEAVVNGQDIPVVVQGATGRAAQHHLRLMRRYGTPIRAGVSLSAKTREIDDVPIFPSCREAVAATGAGASVIMVPPFSVLSAIEEALDAGITLIVSVTEGMPVHDALKAARRVRELGATWIGPSTPGMAIPGRLKLGFLPDAALAPGPLAVLSKSGTLSYELCSRLVARGVGQSVWIGVGGDPVKGARFPDLLPLLQAHRPTQALLVIGEIGGTEEEELAEALLQGGFEKPVFAVLAGSSAPQGVMMGHAGALIHGGSGSVASKVAALEVAGAEVFTRMADAVAAIPARLAGTAP